MPRRPNGVNRPLSMAYSILEADRGWLTAEGISAAGGGNPDSIKRSLQRWLRQGLVEARTVALASQRGSPPESRREWRIVTPDP